MARVSPTGHHLTRGSARLREGSEVHLRVAVVRVGVDGVNGGELYCGRRSSGVHRTGATDHGVKIWWVCSASGSVLSALMGLDASGSGCGHGGAMAGGSEVSGLTEATARGGKRARGERGSA